MTRRTQASRSEATTSDLIEAARSLFGRQGYAATSIEDIAQAAGVTKGAVYHHFDGKAALFRAVYVRMEQDLARTIAAAVADIDHPWAAVRAGCHAFLAACLDAAVRQIALLDAPATLGWEGVRAVQHDHTSALLRRGIETATASGHLRHGDPQTRTHLLVGALCEGGMLLARAADPEATLTLVTHEIDTLLAALARPEAPDARNAAGMPGFHEIIAARRN